MVNGMKRREEERNGGATAALYLMLVGGSFISKAGIDLFSHTHYLSLHLTRDASPFRC